MTTLTALDLAPTATAVHRLPAPGGGLRLQVHGALLLAVCLVARRTRRPHPALDDSWRHRQQQSSALRSTHPAARRRRAPDEGPT
jgi:hypothetical protein